MALVDQVVQGSIDEWDKRRAWRTNIVHAAGGITKLRGLLEDPDELLVETRRRLFAA